MTHSVFVSDFDGTMTAHDFYRLTAEHLLPPDALTPWTEYKAGRMTHFAALQAVFDRIRAPEERVLQLLDSMQFDPDLPGRLTRLRSAGWEVVVASAGCDWYIRRIFARANVQATLHANPGEYLPGGPLRMDPPRHSPFFSPETGVDKAAIVRFHRRQGAVVAYAGDGLTDLPAALLAPPDLRFARGDLALALREKGETFRLFSRWSETADALLARTDHP